MRHCGTNWFLIILGYTLLILSGYTLVMAVT